LLLSQPSLVAQDAPPTATASGATEGPPAADLREPAILVRVLDAEGAPAVGFEVFSEAMGSRSGPVSAGVADPAGCVLVMRVDPGRRTLGAVDAAGRTIGWAEVDVPRAPTVFAVAITLSAAPAPGRIEGVVRGPYGEAIVRGEVRIETLSHDLGGGREGTPEGSFAVRLIETMRARGRPARTRPSEHGPQPVADEAPHVWVVPCDTRGRFALDVPAGRQRVTVVDGFDSERYGALGLAGEREVHVPLGTTATCVVKGWLLGAVEGAVPDPEERIVRLSAMLTSVDRVSPGEILPFEGRNDPWFRIDRVPPGSYRVHVMAQRRTVAAGGAPGPLEIVSFEASAVVPDGRLVRVHIGDTGRGRPFDRAEVPLTVTVRGHSPRDGSPRFVELMGDLHDAHFGLLEGGVARISAPRAQYRARLSFAPREGEGHFVADADVDLRSVDEVILSIPSGRGGLVVHAPTDTVIFSGIDVGVRLITEAPSGPSESAVRVDVIAELDPDTRAARFPYLPAGRYRIEVEGVREAVVEVTDGGVAEHVLVRERP